MRRWRFNDRGEKRGECRDMLAKVERSWYILREVVKAWGFR